MFHFCRHLLLGVKRLLLDLKPNHELSPHGWLHDFPALIRDFMPSILSERNFPSVKTRSLLRTADALSSASEFSSIF
jgi:hypothetical protein